MAIDIKDLLVQDKVGIGTENPTHSLDVNGDVRFTGNLTVTGSISESGILQNQSYGGKINSTYSEFIPVTDSTPLVTEIQGLLLDAPQLVTNGDFSSGTTDWSTSSGGFTVIDGVAEFVPASQFNSIFRTIEPVLTNKYYVVASIKSTSNQVALVYYNLNNSIEKVFHSGSNRFEIISTYGEANSTLTSGLRVEDTRTTGFDKIFVDFVYLFNVTPLILNKQYSPLFDTTFDLMSDANIKTQMDNWITSGTLPSAIKSVSNTTIKSVGRNLFNNIPSQFVNTPSRITYGLNGTLNYIAQEGIDTNIIILKQNTNYIIKTTATITAEVVGFLNNVSITQDYVKASLDGVVLISGNGANGLSFNTGLRNFISIRLYNSSNVSNFNVQIEEGTTATAYTPYESSTQIFNHEELYRLPNGVKDTIEFKNGKYYKIQRVGRTVLQSNNFTGFNNTLYTLVEWVHISTSSLVNARPSSVNNQLYFWYVSGFPNKGLADSTDNYFTSYSWLSGGSDIRLVFPRGTYANLTAAQSALTGTILYYQLLTPVETEIDTDGYLVQDIVTTLTQEQDLYSLYKIDIALNSSQTTKILVDRDRIQQSQIDNIEDTIDNSLVDITTTQTITGAKTFNNTITIAGVTPEIKFIDTDPQKDDFWLHANSDRFYILTDRADDGSYEAPSPLELRNDTASGLLYGNTMWTSGNDGAGSGLDADTLDGNQASFFVNASNLSQGTVPTARLGTGTANNTTFLRGDQTWAVPVDGTKLPLTGGTLTGDLTIQNIYPRIDLIDTDHNSDFSIVNDNGRLQIYDNTDTAYRMTVAATGSVGINEILPTAQLHVKSNATNRVPLIVDSLTGQNVNLQEWKVNGSNKALIDITGYFAGVGLYNIANINNSFFWASSNGPAISRNVADSNAALIVNQIHASSTGDILKLRKADTDIYAFTHDGVLKAPSTFTIDPSAHGDNTGKVIILGDLQVDGTTTTINSTTLEIDDKNIELAKGSADKSAANGAGITVDLGSDGAATIVYASTPNRFEFNKGLTVTGASSITGDFTTTGYVWSYGNVVANSNFYINFNNTNGQDATIFFGDEASDTDHNLKFDTSEQKFATTDGLNVTGDIGVTGTVDGVDIAAFKSDYDTHTHPIADIEATGTADNTTFLRGDGQWATPAGGTDGALRFTGTTITSNANASTIYDGFETYVAANGGTIEGCFVQIRGASITITGGTDASNGIIHTFSVGPVQGIGEEEDAVFDTVVLEDGDWLVAGKAWSFMTTPYRQWLVVNNNDASKANAFNTSNITITTGDWSSNTATITVSGVTSSSILWISPAAASFIDYGNAQIRGTAQGTNSITFTCTTTPTSNIDVVVVRS